MAKKNFPVHQVTSEFADCLEKAFAPRSAVAPGAVSGGAAAEHGANLGGAMSITPSSTSHLGIISEDTAHLSLWVDWGTNEDVLFDRFRRAQLESQGKSWDANEEENPEAFDGQYVDLSKVEFFDGAATSAPGTPELYPGASDPYFLEGSGTCYMEFGGQLWYMMPSGRNGGSGDSDNRRSHYKYHLRAGDVNLFIRRDKHESVANVWLEIGSIPLCRHGGLRNALDEVYKAFREEGITVMREILSRVDIYADYDICGISEFCSRFFNNSRVTRARSTGNYGNEYLNFALYLNGSRYTGVSIGKEILLRCYDKREELKRDPIKWGVFADRYDGIPETLTRVEFQLRRKALKEIQVMEDGGTRTGRIEDVDSYLKVRDGLWRYLTCEWFRFTEEPVDKKNNHHSRAKTWWIWEAVQNAVSSVCDAVKRVRREVIVNPEHLKKMAIGVVMSAALMERPREMDTLRDFVKYFRDIVVEGGRDYFRDVMDKHSKRIFLHAGDLLVGV